MWWDGDGCVGKVGNDDGGRVGNDGGVTSFG